MVSLHRVPSAPYIQWAYFVPLCRENFVGFFIVSIGFFMTYSCQLRAVSSTSFNILPASLVFPSSRNFMDEFRVHHRQIRSWTVGDEKNMDWYKRRGVDGMVTDKVSTFHVVVSNGLTASVPSILNSNSRSLRDRIRSCR